MKVQAVNNIVDALEAQVSTPQTIVAELVSARCLCHLMCSNQRAQQVKGFLLPNVDRRSLQVRSPTPLPSSLIPT